MLYRMGALYTAAISVTVAATAAAGKQDACTDAKGAFPIDASGFQCLGLAKPSSSAANANADACAAACCVVDDCSVWQWSAGGTHATGCWMGTSDSCGKPGSSPSWAGGRRTPTLAIDRAQTSKTFDGLGGLSGGGATSRLLVDYPSAQRDQILDYLFKPQFGASLHILKVEIGGDSQSTDGTETSHMHSADDLNYHRGYEWWLLSEAKKRNPAIKTYGLPWAYPGWVGGPEQSGSPFTHPNLTSTYILKWLEGARDVYNVDIDYIGIWNERSSNAAYAITLRKLLDAAGFANTTLVAKDGGSDICNTLLADKDYADAIGIIGLHYPSDYANYDACHKLGKPIWASEESSSYDDANGAACWARVTASHYALNGMTASIMWNLVGSYFHGTNWYASSMLTAVQPWSGYYEVDAAAGGMPVVWATAHVTQFAQPGWTYLADGAGSGELPQGGYYTSLVDAATGDFTLVVVKISRDHAPCTRPGLPDFDVASETVPFAFGGTAGAPKKPLHVWHSNFEADPTVNFAYKGTPFEAGAAAFSLDVGVGDVYTVSTIATATKGSFPSDQVPASSPQFPLPYADGFQTYAVDSEPRYLSDQIGAWEVHPETAAASKNGNLVLKQMVPELPIGWSDHGSNGPMTLVGMREWQDVSVSARFRLPANASLDASACVGTRADQMWGNAVAICVAANGKWTLSYGGPKLGGAYSPGNVVASGTLAKAPGVGAWHTLKLATAGAKATASFDGAALGKGTFAVRDVDVGFAVLGSNQWVAIEWDDLALASAAKDPAAVHARGASLAAGGNFSAGQALGSADCGRNGVKAAAQEFFLKPNWQLLHVASGLCAEAASAADGAAIALAPCDAAPVKVEQQFRNDYTTIRNNMRAVTLGAYGYAARLTLAGSTDGSVSLCGNALKCWLDPTSGKGWTSWVFFPNTGTLRNQYNTNTGLGYPQCLSVVSS